MKKLKFLSFFAALALLTAPSSKADVIGPKLCARLRTECVYQRLKTELEKDMTLALHGTTPTFNDLLLELFGAYCLIVAAHIHWAPINTCSSWGPMVPRIKVPKGVSKTFILQQRVHAKLPERISRAPILNWSYAGLHYVCNPNIVYEQLPGEYREKSLKWVKDKLSSSPAPTTRRVEHRTYKTW